MRGLSKSDFSIRGVIASRKEALRSEKCMWARTPSHDGNAGQCPEVNDVCAQFARSHEERADMFGVADSRMCCDGRRAVRGVSSVNVVVA